MCRWNIFDSMMQHDLVAVTGTGLDLRWKALASRDTAADGTFVYAVTSTGVYCRPSCPSRRPRADRVRFFDTTAEARQAGFRACKRCRPDMVGFTQPGIEAVRRASVYLATHADQTVTLDHLARVAAQRHADGRDGARVRRRLGQHRARQTRGAHRGARARRRERCGRIPGVRSGTGTPVVAR